MDRRAFIKKSAAALVVLPAVPSCFAINKTRSKMLINVDDHPSLASAVDEATSVKDQGGSTLYVPGRELPYVSDGILWPDNTQVFGDGRGSKIIGRSTISNRWGAEVAQLNFIDGLDLVNCRSTEFNHIIFSSTTDDFINTGLVRVSGASYYNLFSMCNWYKVDRMMEVIGECNKNSIKDSRIHHFGNGLVFKPDAQGKLCRKWSLKDVGFEGWTRDGAGVVDAHIRFRGTKHKADDCWFEVGRNNSYLEYGVIFEKEAAGCKVEDYEAAWKTQFRDRNGSNYY